MSERTGEPLYDERETERLLADALIASRTGGARIPWRAICFGALAFSQAAILSYVGFGWRHWPIGAAIRPYPVLPFVVGLVAAARLGGEPAKWTAATATIFFQAAILTGEDGAWALPEFAPWLAQVTLSIVTIALLTSSPVNLLSHNKINSCEGLGIVRYVKARFPALYQKIVGNARDIDHDRPAPGAE